MNDLVLSAEFSEDRQYRYALGRMWDPSARPVLFIGLNPSTADETVDDPTIRRCIRFARDWGHGGLLMGNLYGWRSTDPRALKLVPAPESDPSVSSLTNVNTLVSMAILADRVVAAWGASIPDGGHAYRVRRHLETICGPLSVLGFTKSGQPRHPLYMRADTKPVRW